MAPPMTGSVPDAELVDQHQRARPKRPRSMFFMFSRCELNRYDRSLSIDCSSPMSMKMLSEDRQSPRPRRPDTEKPALEHVLHDARGFQADRLAAGVGPRDDEDVLATVELQIQRHDLAPLQPAASAAAAGGGRFSAPACRPSRGSAARICSPRPSGPWRAACRSRPGSRPNRRSAPRRDGSLR